MKYAFVLEHEGTFRVRLMCRVLDLSPSGYYAWKVRRPHTCRRTGQRQQFDERVRHHFNANKGRYGAPRLVRDLRAAHGPVSRKTVAKCMRNMNLRAKAARRFKATTNSNHTLPVAANLLQQDFSATAIDQKWVGDITYLWTDEGWLYLATVIDVYSRRVIGWSMASTMTAQLACDALTMALRQRGHPTQVIVHTDRGSQYCSADYQSVITQHKLRCSMSRKGNCYDNAMAESFFHSLKVEAIHGTRCKTRDEMKRTVFEYIEVDYNRRRRHSAIGYISPMMFETQTLA